jgi:cytoskeleton-associated protein 5
VFLHGSAPVINILKIGEIGQILKARATDSNKAVQALALDIISRVATGMGKPFEKHVRLFVVPVATVLSDQKANVRGAALATLSAMASACEGLDSMVPGLATALEATNPAQKGSLLNWLVEWFREHELSPQLDITSWTGSILSSLDDRNGDVRKGAQALLPTLVASAGHDYVMNQTSSLKPASRATVAPLIQAARPSAPAAAPPAKQPAAKVRPAPIVTNGPTSPSPESPNAPPNARSAPAPALPGARKQLPQVARPQSRAETPVDAGPSRLANKIGGLKRPGAPPAPKSAPLVNPSGYAHMPFTSVNIDAKKSRLVKDVSRWVNEGGTTRKDLAELLQHQMEPHSSKELVSLLFSHDHNAVNDHVAGLTMIADFYSSVQAGEEGFGLPIADAQNVCVANSDLALKYASIKAHEPQSNLIAKNLEMVETVLSFLQSINYQLADAEALCFIPTMVHKVCFNLVRWTFGLIPVYSSVTPESQFVSECKALFRLRRRSMLIAGYSKFYLSMVYHQKWPKPGKAHSKNLQTYCGSLVWLLVNPTRHSQRLLQWSLTKMLLSESLRYQSSGQLGIEDTVIIGWTFLVKRMF